MRISQLFAPIAKEAPRDIKSTSHALMHRAGMIRQSVSGIYSWLPLGLRVLQKVQSIIRQEHTRIGFQEMLLPIVQSSAPWRISGRYDDFGAEMLRMEDRHGHQLLFSPTNEEAITELIKENVFSYRNLPLNVYQIQWKFRDEVRPRAGVIRAREFLMKDAYSFATERSEILNAYDEISRAYLRIFKRMDLNVIPISADSGPMGGTLNHEFILECESGESEFVRTRNWQYPKDIENLTNFRTTYMVIKERHIADHLHDVEEIKGIELGHTFYLGKKYSQLMNVDVSDSSGQLIDLEMGCYGIGVSRLIGAIVEKHHDKMGIRWPIEVAPFYISLLNLQAASAACNRVADYMYDKLNKKRFDILYDDSISSAGNKFYFHDLIGSPWQIIVSPKNAPNGMVEIKNRKTNERHELSLESALNFFWNIGV